MTEAGGREIEEAEFHGYLDGELTEQRVDDVEAYLERERKAAERIVHYGMQGDLVRRLYSPLICRPMPPAIAGRLQQLYEQHARGAGNGKGQKTRLLITMLILAATVGALVWLFEGPVTRALANLIPPA